MMTEGMLMETPLLYYLCYKNQEGTKPTQVEDDERASMRAR